MGAVFPSGLLSLDLALEIGGLPRGQIVEVFGPQAVGKTSLCLRFIAAVQQAGGTAVFVDTEYALDPLYAARCGIEVNRLWMVHPENGEQALDTLRRLALSRAVDLIVVDSAAALLPRAEKESALGTVRGAQERLLCEGLRRLSRELPATPAGVVFTNQIRHKSPGRLEGLETAAGGLPLKLHAAVRLELTPSAPRAGRPKIMGSCILGRVVKNKFARQSRAFKFNIMYNGVIADSEELLELAIHYHIIDKRENDFYFDGFWLGHGVQAAWLSLSRDGALSTHLERALRQQALPSTPMPVEED